MLVLTQAGIGLAAGGIFGNSIPLLVLGTAIFNAGMLAAVFHLGQPLKAWRFFLGLKTSWLSREILAFSLFAPSPPRSARLHFYPTSRSSTSPKPLPHTRCSPSASSPSSRA